MDPTELEEEYNALSEEISVGSSVDGSLQSAEFFRLFSEIAAENGDSPDLEYTPILQAGRSGYRVDGYATEISEGESGDSIELYLAVSSYFQEEKVPVVYKKDIEQTLGSVLRFLDRSLDTDYFLQLEEESPQFQLMDLIRRYEHAIARIRVVVFTNAEFRSRKPSFKEVAWREKDLYVNVLDISRYSEINSFGFEPIEIDFENDFGGSVAALKPLSDGGQYSSFLFSISGNMLAEIYSQYGARLLEQNVRTYLQAKTNVNKGILRTIGEEPEMFFAYNNGITATAAKVIEKNDSTGAICIQRVDGMQIVNGGQTTASLLYARDVLKKDLDNVYVQVKLSVINADQLETIVPKISEYANTQNKVSLADLAANSPAQVSIERLSKEIVPPVSAGDIHASRWFYERSRGRYKNMFAYKSPSERKRIELEYPRSKLLSKPDLAKFEYAFDGYPHIVCLGAQKCFLKYTAKLKDLYKNQELNECWYKRVIAKALLFKALDSAVSKQEWYIEDRGYKAQIVAYALASCAKLFRDRGQQIDLDRIWNDQKVPDWLLGWMVGIAESIAKVLKNPPASVANISEFSKKQFCWENHVIPALDDAPEDLVNYYGINIEDFAAQAGVARRDEGRHQDLSFDVALLKLVPIAFDVKKRIEDAGIASPKNMSALSKLSIGNLNLNRGEKNALKAALDRLDFDLTTLS